MSRVGNVVTIPARKGKAVALAKGQRIKVINTHGEQVVDTWAFNRHDPSEFMSMEHTRASLLRVIPRVGDRLYTNKRRPILTLVEDTSPGIHDTVIAACDRYRYEELGCKGHHDSCTDNLAAALGELGLKPPETPSPLNLWMNIPIKPDGSLSFDPPVSRRGDYVVLQAEMDAVVAFSACPQDVLPINGVGRAPTEAHFQVMA
ncbi:MAG: urea carboxylase-associated family protein [Alphaproteobacteria bacterium]|nr:urea carboxylase-associated family protein [Alphaproteobacteria bacterium]